MITDEGVKYYSAAAISFVDYASQFRIKIIRTCTCDLMHAVCNTVSVTLPLKAPAQVLRSS